MKKIRIIAALLLMLAVIVSCTKKTDDAAEIETIVELNWLTNLETAVGKANENGKTVFVNFTGSDWCGWCIKLKSEVFNHKEFADYAEKNLILVELDFPQRIEQTEETKEYNKTVAQKFGVRGFPTIVLVNGSGSEIGRTGYMEGGPVAYVEHLKGFIGR